MFKGIDLSSAIKMELGKIFGLESDSLFNMDRAVVYLNTKGFKITKHTLYKHTAKGTIDFSRFGKRKIVFTKEQLDEFIERMKK